jgi:hypothetical protein
LGTSSTLALDTRKTTFTSTSSKYNISLTYSSELSDVNETNGTLSLKNPTSLTITTLSEANVLSGNYIYFNSKYYFIPAGTSFSEPSSGTTYNKTYTLTCAAA